MYSFDTAEDVYVLTLSTGEEIRFKEVGLLYSQSESLGAVLLKHGDADKVERHYQVVSQAFLAAGLREEYEDLRFIRSSLISPSELNKCISICDYVGRITGMQKYFREKQYNEY